MPPGWQEGRDHDEGPIKPLEVWGYADLVLDLTPGTGRGGLIRETPRLEAVLGKPTVRNFREGAGNVSYGRTRTPLRHRKSGDRKLPTYGCARLCSTRPEKVRMLPHGDIAMYLR